MKTTYKQLVELIQCGECNEAIESGFINLNATYFTPTTHTEVVAGLICSDCVKDWLNNLLK